MALLLMQKIVLEFMWKYNLIHEQIMLTYFSYYMETDESNSL